MMIRSMTGFGEASQAADGIEYTVEVRSLNNRYFKSSIRLPEDFAYLETQLEQSLRRALIRGSTDRPSCRLKASRTSSALT